MAGQRPTQRYSPKLIKLSAEQALDATCCSVHLRFQAIARLCCRLHHHNKLLHDALHEPMTRSGTCVLSAILAMTRIGTKL